MTIKTKAFGAVNVSREHPQFDPRYCFRTAKQVRERIAHDHSYSAIPKNGEKADEVRDLSLDENYKHNWPYAYSLGWRVVPIEISGELKRKRT